MDKDLEPFRGALIRLRRRHNYSQEELRELIGLPSGAISKYERSDALPLLSNFRKIMLFFMSKGHSAEELVTNLLNLKDVK
jgi:transcriptional regulator with XRE-family HTH domain